MLLLSKVQVALASLLTFSGDVPTSRSTGTTATPTHAEYRCSLETTACWGSLSPYKESNGFNVPKGFPRNCELSQVHVLQRHGQRYPEDSSLDGGIMEEFSRKLKRYCCLHPNGSFRAEPLSFLNRWQYHLGRDDLLTTGAAAAAACGANVWSKYGRLLYRAPSGVAAWEPWMNVFPNGTKRPKPVFRATNSSRIVESARWWSGGFFGDTDAKGPWSQYDLVIMPEGHGLNNTLAPQMSCPRDSSEGTRAARSFVSRFTRDGRARLSKFFPDDFNLTSSDILAMMNLCPYESAAMGSSPFCALFTHQEWEDFAFNMDLQLYGNSGFGSPTGRAQGIGYLLELAARLELRLITESDSSINTTYDSNPATFPLHQPLFMDMAHHEAIVGAITALGCGYFNYGRHGLPSNVAHSVYHKFCSNEVAPMGSHLVSEVWTCPNGSRLDKLDDTIYENPNISDTQGATNYIRFVLNDAPLPLTGFDGCGHAKEGFCEVSEFLRGVPRLKRKAMYQKACYGNYTSGHQVGDGRPEFLYL